MVLGFLRSRRRNEPAEDIAMGTLAPDALSPGTGSEAAGSETTFNALRRFEKMHHLDPNLPIDELNDIDAVLASSDAEKGVEIEQVLVEDNSPYPEVRAAVRNYDLDVPANTLRAWTIGLLLCTIGSGVNMLYSLRSPGVTITTYVIQLAAYPIGLLWDLIFPDYTFNVWGLKLNLKPGKFNFKEHVVIVVMSNAAYGDGALYATDVIVAQQHFYKQYFGWLWQILFGVTTLCTGYGLAGLSRRFLVWPAAMIWPSTLVNATLFYALHDHAPADPAKTNGWSTGRFRWFLIICVAAFAWYWVPGWIFQGLTWFCWITWIWPDSVVVNKLFGGYSGYGLIPVSFDWTIVAGYLSSPMIPPFHAIANTVAGVLCFFVVTSMGLHFSGHWYSDFLPVQSSEPYDNTAQPYEPTFVLDKSMQFDEEAYHSYSPLYLSTQSALSYGVGFAAVAAVIVHVVLYHGPDLWAQLRTPRRDQEDDIHTRLMSKYRDAEDWWYAALLTIMIGISFAVVCAWPTGFPWWGFVVCIAIPLIWAIPIGVVQAVTNIQVGLNVFTEYVVGYLLPGRPLAMMMFKNYGYQCMSQGLYFAQDLKLGHYMKVPPRVMFCSQLVASVWSAVVQIAVMNWALANIPQICNDRQPEKFVCPGARVSFNASVIWGAIGPARMFGPGALYAGLQWFWLVGVLTPVIAWFFVRRYPRSLWRYVNLPVFFGGAGWIPPATVYMYLCWGVIGTIFNFGIKRRFKGWWMQYNYITSAALDCGLTLSTIVIFFSLYLTSAQSIVWFGNAEALGTLDLTSKAVRESLPHGAIFGPDTWA